MVSLLLGSDRLMMEMFVVQRRWVSGELCFERVVHHVAGRECLEAVGGLP